MASKKSRKLTAAEIDAEEVSGTSIAKWESRFRDVEGGFRGNLDRASHRIGVILVLHQHTIKYVGSGTGSGGQGLLARLRQIAFTKSTGGEHFGAVMIRAHLEDLELKLLMFKRTEMAADDVNAIARLLRKKYNPVWNAPDEVTKAAMLESIIGRR